jgi:tRNA1(Val) A37 N6-methylase TrmN6
MWIVEEMMQKADEAYSKIHGSSLFTNPELKWFDPACGMGNYPVAVYLRLMKGLEKCIPNKDERKKHILENMIYMSELNQKNVFICKQMFNVEGTFKMNLYQGDSLALNVVDTWGIDKFDIVMGNPPYNKGGIKSRTGKQLGKKNETIWPHFVDMAFKHLKKDGLLTYITPLSWLKKTHSHHDKLLTKYIVWLKLWDNIQSKKMINAVIPISIYVIQNTSADGQSTDIVSENKSKNVNTRAVVVLNPKYSIPLSHHSIYVKLMHFIESRNLSLKVFNKTVKSEGERVKLPTTYTLQDGWAVDTFTLKDGIIVKKAIGEHPSARRNKLIIANKMGFKGAFIDEGKLSLTGCDKFYILGKNLPLLLEFFKFSIIDMVSSYLKYRMGFLDKAAFSYIPDIRKLDHPVTEQEFYTLLGLTQEELKLL